MTETRIIKTNISLAHELKTLLEKGFVRGNISTSGGGKGIDGNLNIRFGKSTRRFPVVFDLHPASQRLKQLAELKHQLKVETVVVVSPKISETLVAVCQSLGLSCIDLNGRMWIAGRDFLIDRVAAEKRFKPPTPFPDLFREKSSRIARLFLSCPDRKWSQSELVKRAAISLGLVSRLLNAYIQLGFVRKAADGYRLIQFDALLDLWVKEDRFDRRVVAEQFSILGNPENLAKEIQAFFGKDLAFTQWFAANRRFPFTTSPYVTAYVRQLPGEHFLRKFAARRVDEGGNIHFYLPTDNGVFMEVQEIAGMQLVCDVQIYLDLLSTGLRGADHAQALRNWNGFPNRNLSGSK